MIFAIIIILVAIAYSYSQREEPVRIAYAGGVALAGAAISFIIFFQSSRISDPLGRTGDDANHFSYTDPNSYRHNNNCYRRG